MRIEDNKRLVKEFLARFGEADLEGALAMMTDDCTWWIGGKPELFALAGTKTKAEMTELLGQLVPPMKNGLQMTLHGITAEGERVAAEVESYGENPDGSVYNNDYHFLFVVRGGKLAQVKEYLDPMHTKAVFFPD